MRIATNTPVDKTAVLVTSKGPNESVKQFRPSCRVGALSYSLPRAIKEPPSNTESYIGYKFGRMTVTGFIGTKKVCNGKKKNGTKRYGNNNVWEVRCTCGKYEVRTSRALNRTKQGNILSRHACNVCTNKYHHEREDIINCWRPI